MRPAGGQTRARAANLAHDSIRKWAQELNEPDGGRVPATPSGTGGIIASSFAPHSTNRPTSIRLASRTRHRAAQLVLALSLAPRARSASSAPAARAHKVNQMPLCYVMNFTDRYKSCLDCRKPRLWRDNLPPSWLHATQTRSLPTREAYRALAPFVALGR